MSEQKSLPRRGRSRYHHQLYQFSTNTTPRHHNNSKNSSSNNPNKILSPRSGVGNLKSISSTFKSQDSIQCHIPTLVKSPSITQQQQLQQQNKQQQQQSQQQPSSSNINTSSSFTSSNCSKISQQPLLVTPKIAPHHSQQLQMNTGQHQHHAHHPTDLLDSSSCTNSLASVAPTLACMQPSSQFRPIAHKADEGLSGGTLLNPSTAPLSSKFFTAPTLPK